MSRRILIRPYQTAGRLFRCNRLCRKLIRTSRKVLRVSETSLRLQLRGRHSNTSGIGSRQYDTLIVESNERGRTFDDVAYFVRVWASVPVKRPDRPAAVNSNWRFRATEAASSVIFPMCFAICESFFRCQVLKRSIFLTSLLLAFASLAFSQPKSEYPPLCFVHSLAVGEIPNQPFAARVVETPQQISQSGNGVALKSVESLLALVVRDSDGRVSARSRISSSAPGSENNQAQWSETICDPLKATNRDITYQEAGDSFGQDRLLPIPDDAKGNAFIRRPDRRTTIVFAYWNRLVDGRDNLGPETFEGIPAYRYHLTRTHDEYSVHPELFLEHIPHLHRYFVIPADVSAGRYRTPQEPGSSSDIL